MPRGQAKEPDPRVRHIRYRCTRCDAASDDLTTKQVAFLKGGRRIRQRVVAWLCPECLEADTEWSLPKRASAPGMAGTKLAD
jgi:hypothetical protein